MADCQTLCDAVNGITSQLVINNTMMSTKLTDIYTILALMHTQMNVQSAYISNIEIDLFNMEMVHTSILLDLDEVIKAMRSPANPLNTLYTELKALTGQFKGTDTIWSRLNELSDDAILIENALYNDTHTDSIGESAFVSTSYLQGIKDNTKDIGKAVDNVTAALVVISGLIATISVDTTTIAGAMAGVITAIGTVTSAVGTVVAALTTLNTTALPISQFFITLHNVDDIILAIEDINILLDTVKESIETISIEVFQSKQGQVFQVKG